MQGYDSVNNPEGIAVGSSENAPLVLGLVLEMNPETRHRTMLVQFGA